MTAAVGEYEEEEEKRRRRRKERDGEKNHTLLPHSEFLFDLNAHNITTHIEALEKKKFFLANTHQVNEDHRF